MSAELVPFDDGLAGQGDRGAALKRLMNAAEEAATPEDANAIMIQGRIISEALQAAKQPFEEAWLAGKASVLAARKLGRHFNSLSGKVEGLPGRGWGPSERGRLRIDLGISPGTAKSLMRLADIPDPDFQRYIQMREGIPSLGGALRVCHAAPIYPRRPHNQTWRGKRRRKLGVTTPTHPSLDEAISLIVKALGHLGGLPAGGGKDFLRARGEAMDFLYLAEDALRPFRGGYVK